jgi:hypothetical protein
MDWPTPWDCAGIGLAIIGILMAAQPFLQISRGQPNLRVKFERSGEARNDKGEWIGEQSLECKIYNVPLRSGFPYWLGVRTQSCEGAVISFVVDGIQTRSGADSVTEFPFAERMTICPSIMHPIIFPILRIHPSNGASRIVTSGRQYDPLSVGRYPVTILVDCGDQFLKVDVNLYVLHEPPYATWEVGYDKEHAFTKISRRDYEAISS